MGISKRVRKTGAIFLATLLLMHTIIVSSAFAAWQPRFLFEGRIGTERSSGTFELMTPLVQDDHRLVFVDVRGVASTDESAEGNLGIGYRWIPEGGSAIYGTYLYGDRRRTASGNLWNQVTVGFEVIGGDTDFRINAYVPRTERQLASSVQADTIVVNGINLIYQDAVLNTYETAMGGFDVGFGRRLSALGGDTRLGIRGYHFTADDMPSMTGGSIRVETRYHDVLNIQGSQLVLGLEGQSDNLRGGQGFVTFGLSVPFGMGTVKSRSTERELADRMMDPVQRDIDVVTATTDPVRVIEGESEATHPETGEVVNGILFVSADGDTDAEGKYEDPLDVTGVNQRLADAAQDGPQMVLVVPVGENEIHTGADGLVLKPGNILLSQDNFELKSSLSGDVLPFSPGVDPTPLVNDDNPVIVVSSDNAIIGIETWGGLHSVLGQEVSGLIELRNVTLSGTSDSVVNLTAAESKDLGLRIVNSTLKGSQGVSLGVSGADNVSVNVDNTSVTSGTGPALSLGGTAAGNLEFVLSNSAVTAGADDVGTLSLPPLAASGDPFEAVLFNVGGNTVEVAIENASFDLGGGNFQIDVEGTERVTVDIVSSDISQAGDVAFHGVSSEGDVGVAVLDVDVLADGMVDVYAVAETDASIVIAGVEPGETIVGGEIEIAAHAQSGAATIDIMNETLESTTGNVAIDAWTKAEDAMPAVVEITESEIEAAGDLNIDAKSDGEVAVIMVGDSRFVATDGDAWILAYGANDAAVFIAESEVEASNLNAVAWADRGDASILVVDALLTATGGEAVLAVDGGNDGSVTIVTTDDAARAAKVQASGDVNVWVEAVRDASMVVVSMGAESEGELVEDDGADAVRTTLGAEGDINVTVNAREDAVAVVSNALFTSDGDVRIGSRAAESSTVEIADSAVETAGNMRIGAASNTEEADVSIRDSDLSAAGNLGVLALAREGDGGVEVTNSSLAAQGNVTTAAYAGALASVWLDESAVQSDQADVRIGAASKTDFAITYLADTDISAAEYLDVGAIALGEDGDAEIFVLDSQLETSSDDVRITALSKSDAGIYVGTMGVGERAASIVAGDDIRVNALASGDAVVVLVTQAIGEDAEQAKTTLQAGDDVAIRAASKSGAAEVQFDVSEATAQGGMSVRASALEGNAAISVSDSLLDAETEDMRITAAAANDATIRIENAEVQSQGDDVVVNAFAGNDARVLAVGTVISAGDDVRANLIGRNDAKMKVENAEIVADDDIKVDVVANNTAVVVMSESTLGAQDDVLVDAASRQANAIVVIEESEITAQDRLGVDAQARQDNVVIGVANSTLATQDGDVNIQAKAGENALVGIVTTDAERATSITAGDDIRLDVDARGGALVGIGTLLLDGESEEGEEGGECDCFDFLTALASGERLTTLQAGRDVEVDVNAGEGALVLAANSQITAGDDVKVDVASWRGNVLTGILNSEVTAGDDVEIDAASRRENAIVGILNSELTAEDRVDVDVSARRGNAVLGVVNSTLTATQDDVNIDVDAGENALVAIVTTDAERATSITAGDDIRLDVDARGGALVGIGTLLLDGEAEEGEEGGEGSGFDLLTALT